MSSGDLGTTVAYADYNSTYVAGNETATGPITSGQFHWKPSPTVSFEHSGLTWTPIDIPLNLPKTTLELDGDIFADMRSQMAKLMAKSMDDLIMNGPKPKKKEKKMPKNDERTLYNVFVIDPEGDGEVIATLENVVAKNPAAAEKKAVFALASNLQTAEKLDKDLEDYDFLVEDVADFGSIRSKKDE